MSKISQIVKIFNLINEVSIDKFINLPLYLKIKKLWVTQKIENMRHYQSVKNKTYYQ